MESTTKNDSKTGREIFVERTFNAPVELVWEVFTKREHIKEWWGPNGFTNTIEKMDVKPEGQWKFVMHGPDGEDFENLNIYKIIEKYQKIVMEHVGWPNHLYTITFTAQGNKTHVHWHMLFESEELLEQVVRTHGVDKGLEQNIEKLGHYLSENVQAIIPE